MPRKSTKKVKQETEENEEDMEIEAKNEGSETAVCAVCENQQNQSKPMKTCDNCSKTYHLECLKTKQSKSHGSWICPVCAEVVSKQQPKFVEEILDERVIAPDVVASYSQSSYNRSVHYRTEYLVKYEGLAETHNQWIDSAGIKTTLIHQYNNKKKQKRLNALQEKLKISPQPSHFINIQNCCPTCSTLTLISALEHNRLDVADEILKQNTYTLQGNDNAFLIAIKHNHLEIASKIMEASRKKMTFNASTFQGCSSFELSKEAFTFLYENAKGFRAKSLENNFLPESLAKGFLKNVEFAVEKLVERDESEGGEKKSGFTRLHLQALTARKVSEITAQVNEEAANAGSTVSYITPTHLAALNPHPEILKHLVENGGDLTVHDNLQHIALHYAILAKDGPEVAKFTLSVDKMKAVVKKEKSSNSNNNEEEEDKEEEHDTEDAPKKGAKRATKTAAPSRSSKRVRRNADAETVKEAAVVTSRAKTPKKEVPRFLELQLVEGASPTLVFILSQPIDDIGIIVNAEYTEYYTHINSQGVFQCAQAAGRLKNFELLDRNRYFDGHHGTNMNFQAVPLNAELLAVALADHDFAVETSVCQTYIQNALPKDDTQLVELAIGAGMHVTDYQDSQLSSLFHQAIRSGALAVAKYLHEVYKLPIQDEAAKLNTPLHSAVSSGRVDIVEWLLKSGADANSVNEDGQNVFMAAVSAGHIATIKFFVENAKIDINAPVSPPYEIFDEEAFRKSQPKPVEIEWENDDAEVKTYNLFKLVESARNREDIFTCVLNTLNPDLSVHLDNTNVFHLLVQHGTEAKIVAHFLKAAKPDVLVQLLNQPNVTGYTPVLLAGKSASFEVLNLYLDVKGIDVSVMIPEWTDPKEELEAKKQRRAMDSDDEEEDDMEVQPVAKPRPMDPGHSLLHLLVKRGSLALPSIQKVLNLGADPSVVKNDKTKAPILVDSNNYLDISTFLLNYKPKNFKQVDPNSTDAEGQTILHKVLLRGNDPIEHLATLLQCPKATPFNVNLKDNQGKTPLHLAAQNSAMCVRFLLKEKAELDAFDNDKNTPLALAVLNSNVHIAMFLIESGSNFNLMMRSTPKQPKKHSIRKETEEQKKEQDTNKVKKTIFQQIVSQQANSLVYCMLESGKLDYTAAFVDSIVCGNISMAERLINHPSISSASLSPTLLNSLFQLSASASSSILDRFKQLVEELVQKHNVPVNNQDKNGNTPLQLAVSQKHSIKLVQLLFEKGAAESFVKNNNHGLNPLHEAISIRNPQILDLLFRKLPETVAAQVVNSQDSQGNTALHYATGANSKLFFKNVELVEKLLKFGADPFISNKNGQSIAFFVGTLPSVWAGKYRDIMLKSVQNASKFNDDFGKGKKSRTGKESQWNEKRQKKQKELQPKIQKLKEMRDANVEEEIEKEKTKRKINADKLKVELDQCVSWLGNQGWHVYVSGQDIYDAMLNQTDIGYGTYGHNKFYVVQLLEHGVSEKEELEIVKKKRKFRKRKVQTVVQQVATPRMKYKTVNRWGRVGEYGQTKVIDFTSLDAAKLDFEKKFQQKTKNKWADRESFVKHPNKYHIVEKHYEEEVKKEIKKDKKEIPTKLSEPVAELMQAITNKAAVNKDFSNFHIDEQQVPLGRLSKAQLREGYQILKDMEKEIQALETINQLRGKKREAQKTQASVHEKKLVELSNKFYTIIPHNFGRSLPPSIRTLEDVKVKVTMLDSMGDLQILQKLLKLKDETRNPLDVYYEALGADIQEIERSSDTWNMIQKFMDGGKMSYRPQILNLYKVSRWEELERFEPHRAKGFQQSLQSSTDNAGELVETPNMLLWHGSGISNFVGILSQGLRIAPPEAPRAGYMFGKGLYFADVFAKSVPYCRHSGGRLGKGTPALMLLCEVAVGRPYKLKWSEYMESPHEGYDSTQGQGINVPNGQGTAFNEKGTAIPLGTVAAQDQEEESYSLNFNEYIVYDESRVKIKYMCMVNW